MKEIATLVALIQNCIHELEVVVSNTPVWNYNEEPVRSTYLLLVALKEGATKDYNKMDIRILRGMHDLGMASFKEFENTPLETSIPEILDFLRKHHPTFNGLKPLGKDFGKGKPV